MISHSTPKSYEAAHSWDAERVHREDKASLEALDLGLSIPTAKDPYSHHWNTELIGSGNIGDVFQYETQNGIPRAYKIVRDRDIPAFNNITAATDLRLVDHVLRASIAHQKVSDEARRLGRQGYGHVEYSKLQDSYIPCQRLDVARFMNWLNRRAQYMGLGDVSTLNQALAAEMMNHKGGLVSLVNNLAEFVNKHYVAAHLNKNQAEQYASGYGLSIDSIREGTIRLYGQDVDGYHVPMIPFRKVFPEHIMGGINDRGQWFLVMELLQPSMGDTMQEVAEMFSEAADQNGRDIDINGILRKVESTYDVKHLKQIEQMLAFLHILGLTVSDLKEDNIAYDQAGNVLITDLSPLQRIGKQRLYGSPEYMTDESFGYSEEPGRKRFVGRPEDDIYALGVIRDHWREFLHDIPKLAKDRAKMQQYRKAQENRRQESRRATAEYIRTQ